MQSKVIFECNLTKKGELRYAANNNAFLPISVARNYSRYNETTKQWKEIGTFYSNLALFGKQAEGFAQSNIPLGTSLIVSGRYNARNSKAYVDKNGLEHPSRPEEEILVEDIAVKIVGYATIDVVKKNGQGSTPMAQAATSAPRTQANTNSFATQQPTSTPVNNTPVSTEDDSFGEEEWDF